ncbi:MAG: helix-turn-helix transcriptional regulator [Synergistaceae bacterium]|nr:helix-turn-helix transcriptional regulator [Synergistaceae bacterium]
MLKLSEKLKKCRKDAGMTQVEMAEAIGVHPNTFRKWEGGERIPNASKLVDIAKAAGTSVEWLLDLNEKSKKNNNIKHNIINISDTPLSLNADAVKSIALAAMPVIFTPALVEAAGKDDFIRAVSIAADQFADAVLS